jgi:hypothetical protein
MARCGWKAKGTGTAGRKLFARSQEGFHQITVAGLGARWKRAVPGRMARCGWKAKGTGTAGRKLFAWSQEGLHQITVAGAGARWKRAVPGRMARCGWKAKGTGTARRKLFGRFSHGRVFIKLPWPDSEHAGSVRSQEWRSLILRDAGHGSECTAEAAPQPDQCIKLRLAAMVLAASRACCSRSAILLAT